MENWPRLRDLPGEEREPFATWLSNVIRPRLDGVADEDQDAYYPWDYIAWCGVPPGHRLVSWLKIPFGDSAIDAAMKAVGAVGLDQIHVNRPAGIRLADYQLENFVIEVKTLELEPLDVLTRQQKVREFVERHNLKGLTHLTPEQSNEFGLKVTGVPVRRVIEDAADQLASTFRFLQRTDLIGAILIINRGADTISPTSLLNLTKYFADRLPEISLVMVFNLIPVVVEGFDKPAIVFEWEIKGCGACPVAQLIEESLFRELHKNAGKPLERFALDATAKLRTIRGPYRIEGEGMDIAIR